MNPFLDYLLQAIPLGMTILLGCVGEILTEKAGHLNLGIPGIMCMGCTFGCVALQKAYEANLPPVLLVIITVLAAFAGGVLMGMLYSFLTVTLKANQNVTGLTMTIFGAGATKFVMLEMTEWMNANITPLRAYFCYPFGGNTTSLRQNGVLTWLVVILALIAAFVLLRTRMGLHLRAVGESPATADAVGINVTAYKYVATCIGSGIAALGGVYYTFITSGSPEAYKSIEGFGWIAVALVIFSLWKPHIGVLGSIVFGALYIANSYIKGIPEYLTPLLQMLPYVFTIAVLIITSVRKKREHQPPASLGLPYFREER